MADFKVPRDVELVAGLPASAVGKVLKRLLRKGQGITRLSEINAAEDYELDPVFQMMPLLFKPEKAGAWKARIRYQVFGPGGGIWTIRVEDKTMTVVRAAEENPTATVKVYAQTFMKIVTREMDGMSAVNSGLMQIEGSQADAAMFYEVLE
jgi:alkyl sulfatase BDS1-like metallo-beta-lactamase superfamily hydrolase